MCVWHSKPKRGRQGPPHLEQAHLWPPSATTGDHSNEVKGRTFWGKACVTSPHKRGPGRFAEASAFDSASNDAWLFIQVVHSRPDHQHLHLVRNWWSGGQLRLQRDWRCRRKNRSERVSKKRVERAFWSPDPTLDPPFKDFGAVPELFWSGGVPTRTKPALEGPGVGLFSRSVGVSVPFYDFGRKPNGRIAPSPKKRHIYPRLPRPLKK